MHLKNRKYLQIRGLITKERYDHAFGNVRKKKTIKLFYFIAN